ncbi:MAG: hypothetical protein H0W72_06535 [Planctomycetes bacterium]|nr:hypothetical protein [Planctomycetota bacterium]
MPTYDISRDFLDGILLQQPQTREGKEIRANGSLHFLPSSPDGTMHTAVVQFELGAEGSDQPFARAGWRFLFTSDSAADPKNEAQSKFFQDLMMVGMGKIMVQLNNLCMHANLPLVPFEPQRMVRSAKPSGPAPAQA